MGWHAYFESVRPLAFPAEGFLSDQPRDLAGSHPLTGSTRTIRHLIGAATPRRRPRGGSRAHQCFAIAAADTGLGRARPERRTRRPASRAPRACHESGPARTPDALGASAWAGAAGAPDRGNRTGRRRAPSGHPRSEWNKAAPLGLLRGPATPGSSTARLPLSGHRAPGPSSAPPWCSPLPGWDCCPARP